MSESTGPLAMSGYNVHKMGSVGKDLPGCKGRLADKNEKGEGKYTLIGPNGDLVKISCQNFKLCVGQSENQCYF